MLGSSPETKKNSKNINLKNTVFKNILEEYHEYGNVHEFTSRKY